MSDPNPMDTLTGAASFLNCGFQSDVFNEMCHRPGELRPHWAYLGQSLDAMGEAELLRRNHEARRLISDNDVTYNIYSDPRGMGRPWDLDLVPLLIESEEWSRIERGLIQRAELLNLILEDIYGPRNLIKQGILPLELVYAFPSFLRPCDAIQREDGRYLHMYAADLGRSPDGEFQVIADRTQAPSGAGYALENRIVLSRVLPSLFRDSHVHRLAPFFRVMRNTLNSLAPKPASDPRIVLLSPGVGNESYFEHAYLANYLGYTLVQGGDLTVRDGHVWLKTLDSLQQVDVILRRVDDGYCDPLELREDSYLGVPGLLQVVRDGNVTIANPLGSGVLENTALMAYLPKIAQYFFGEDLHLSNTEIWWCGNKEHKSYVLANIKQLVIRPFYPQNNQRSIFGDTLSDTQIRQLTDQINARPHLFTAQSRLSLSVAPVLQRDARLDNRHVVVRSYLVAHDSSYIVMPGALSRVSAARDNYMVSNQMGGTSKDTWVLASEPERQETLITVPPHVINKSAQGGHVPSRVADNLFWLGRYSERAEGLVRLLRVIQSEQADSALMSMQDQESSFAFQQLLRALTNITAMYPGFIGKDAQERLVHPEQELLAMIIDRDKKGSLAQTLDALLMTARSVRDRLSMDTLRVINDIDVVLGKMNPDNMQHLNDADDELDDLITALVGFSGLINENMTHEQGWHFLQAGRKIERAIHTTRLIHSTLVIAAPVKEETLVEFLLSVIDSLMTYKRNFLLGFEVPSFLHLVLLNESNPRSVCYQLMRIQEHVTFLPVDRAGQQLSPEERLILELLTQLRLAVPDELATLNEDTSRRDKLDKVLMHIQQQLQALSDIMTRNYFQKEAPLQQLVRMRPGGAE